MAENNQTPINQEEYEPDLITLEDEEGKEYSFEVLDAADLNDQHYLAVVPYVENEEDLLEADLNLILLRTGENEEGEFMETVEDDDEYAQVADMFEKRLSEFFDFEK